jgi:hypothetical protein
MSLFFNNLFNEILIKPIYQGADELCIVSGYATANMAMRHIEAVRREFSKDIALRIIVGMSPQDGIQRSQHISFQKLATGEFKNDFECYYITDRPPVHSKVYTWLKNGQPLLGFLGSANYTQNAFSSSMREILATENAHDCFEYYQSLLSQSISCLSENIPHLIDIFEQQKVIKKIKLQGEEQEIEALSDIISNLEKVTLTLIDKRTGEVPKRSGLNWGQREGREPNQAYINIPSYIGSSDFFPDRYKTFMVRTDDGVEFICVRAQDSGKGLHTTLNNSLIGEYFRFRLGLKNGAFVTKDDLLRYGRTDVDFYKIDEETYLMDFSVH